MYLATPCDRRCMAWFPSVSMPFGYTLRRTLHRVVFFVFSMPFGYTLYFDLYLATP